jgi:hypothetical protein
MRCIWGAMGKIRKAGEAGIYRMSEGLYSKTGKTGNQVQHTQCQTMIEVISGGHGGDVLDEGEVVFVGFGGADREIEPGGGFALQNRKPSPLCSVLVCYESD